MLMYASARAILALLGGTLFAASGDGLRETEVVFLETLCGQTDSRIVRILFTKCELGGVQLQAGCKCTCPDGTELNTDNYESEFAVCLPLGHTELFQSVDLGYGFMRAAFDSVRAAEALTGGEPLRGGFDTQKQASASPAPQPTLLPEMDAAFRRAPGSAKENASETGLSGQLREIDEAMGGEIGPSCRSLFERVHTRYKRHYP